MVYRNYCRTRILGYGIFLYPSFNSVHFCFDTPLNVVCVYFWYAIESRTVDFLYAVFERVGAP